MTMKTQKRGRSIVPTHSQPNTRRKWVISTTFQLLFPLWRPGTHCTEGSMGFGVGLPSTENLVSAGIRSPEHPGCNDSLCQLWCTGHLIIIFLFRNQFIISSTQIHDPVCCDLMTFTSLIPIYLWGHPHDGTPSSSQLSRSVHLCLLASNTALFRAPTSDSHYASHACQICQLTNGRAGWPAEVQIKEGSPGCEHSLKTVILFVAEYGSTP